MSPASPPRFTTEEYLELATKPTSNEMFDNGAWLAPILDSRDPQVDKRANHAIHYYAEDAELSVCGNRFGPSHYVETHPSPEEPRRRCASCHRVVSAVRAGITGAAVNTVLPEQKSYTIPEFRDLITGTTRIRMRLNRRATINGVLYLMVDHGVVHARSLRRDMHHDLATATRIELVWAGTSAVEHAHDQREHARDSLLLDLQSLRARSVDTSPFVPRQDGDLPPDPDALEKYLKRRAQARREILGNEPPAPKDHVDIFNAAYDAASPDWPVAPAQIGIAPSATSAAPEAELVA